MPLKKRSSDAAPSSSKRARKTISLSPDDDEDEEPESPPARRSKKPIISKPTKPTKPTKINSLPLAPYTAKVATDDYTVVQHQLCQRWKRSQLDEHCTSCIERQAASGGCRFIGVRAFKTHVGEKGKKKVDINDYAFMGNQGVVTPAPVETKISATKKKESKKGTQKTGTAQNSDPEALGQVEEEPIVIPPEQILPSAADAKYVLSLIAPTFADHLRREKRHEDNHTNLSAPESSDRGGRRPMIRIQASPLTRSLCDICATSIFMGSYMCGCCGREMCLGCWEAWEPSASQPGGKIRRLDNCSRKRRHSRESMLFMTRAAPGELSSLIGKVSAYETVPAKAKNEEYDDKLIATIPTEKQTFPRENGPFYHPVPKIHHSDLSNEAFQALWRKGGIPLVLTGLLPSFQLPWDPAYFIRYFGKERCLIHDCGDDSVFESNVAQFFESFASPDPAQSWKLKDWPPTADFSTTFPSLFADFENAIPYPAYTRRKGPLNLASYFPETANPPDLGPKMYNAFPAPDFLPTPRRDGKVKGTTNLHLDLTDAVNIMLYTAPSTDETRDTSQSNGVPKDVGAVWDFFKPEDAGTLRQYLKKKYDPKVDDPIHRQIYYLSETDLAALAKEDVGSYRVYQNPGEAVWIPAGCAHQVRNRKACVKVAVDFLSAENVATCKRLQEEARSMAGEFMRGLGKKEDVLQLWAGCGWAWGALEKVLEKENERKHEAGNKNGTAEVEVRDLTME